MLPSRAQRQPRHNSPGHRQGFGICFGRAYIEGPLDGMEAKWEGQTFREFEHEFLEALPRLEHQPCECNQRKATILWLFP